MASDKEFMFEKKVGVLPKNMTHPMEHDFVEPPTVFAEMVQDGFKAGYDGKKFVFKTLDELLDAIKKWFEDKMKEAAENDKS